MIERSDWPMPTIKNVIKNLGYSSPNLHYPDSKNKEITSSLKKLFKELDPAAIYLADNKPFIAFFDFENKDFGDKQTREKFFVKVWNAQIPLSIINFQDRIEIYNGCSINNNKELILLEIVSDSIDSENTPFSFWKIADTGFWKEYEQELSKPKLDEVLLDNIRAATKNLRKTKCKPFAVQIILRLIFIRYLIDRGINLDYPGFFGEVTKSRDELNNIMQNKTDLYKLFAYLKDRFNGNLFELYKEDNLSEKDLLDNSSLEVLRTLISGNEDLSSGQISLFPLYDFNIIPVELISNIYERFLGDKNQKEDKAFYTPPYLVSFLLKKTIAPFIEKNTSCKILDPACGSGIFLVESARKLIEEKSIQNSNVLDNSTLINIVTDNLWGVDKNPEAIDVAIFSLYITILDYKDPKTLKNFKFPLLKGKNLFVCDFFSSEIEKELGGKHFDFIIGNPPWGSVKGLHITYCKQRGLPIHENEISRSFILRTKDFSTPNTTCCCQIVTSKLFYNTESSAISFRKWLLENTKVSRYIELAAVRELIFTKARGPAGVIVYRFTDEGIESNKKNELCHLTLKPNIFFKLFHIIVIEKNDYKYVPQTLLIENDWAWKTLVFGHAHDFRIIKSLFAKHSSVTNIIDKYKLRYGKGICVTDGDKEDARHLVGRWLIEAEKGIRPFVVNKSYGSEFTKKNIHRAKKNHQDLFNSPYVLIKKGFSTKNYKLKAAYSEDDFLYTDAITGICGQKKNKNVLLALTGLYNSSFYSYLNLMIGSSSGIEREQIFYKETFKYPAIIDTDIAKQVKKIISELTSEGKKILHQTESDNSIKELDRIILKKFGLSDDVFVDYALKVQIPLLSNRQNAWEKITSKDLHIYSKVFTNYFSTITGHTKKHIAVKLYENIINHYCAVQLEFQDNKPVPPIEEYNEENQKSFLNLMSKLTTNKTNNLFYQIKDVICFSENSFYILKTNEYRNWHPAMAKLDLADVLDSILLQDKAARNNV